MLVSVVIILATMVAANAEPKRVLLLESFGRDFAPWDEFLRHFREDLFRQSPEPIDLYEVSLATARFAGDPQEGPFVDYLRALFADHQLDLVITIGAPAAAFIERNRQQLFPSVPILYTAVEQRRVPPAGLTGNDTAVALTIDFAGVIENILRVLPETNNIAVVIGNSPIEKYWLEQVREAVQPFTSHVSFTWFNELSFDEMLKRAGALPSHSAIYFELLSVDAAGVPHEGEKVIERLHAVANAPMFSYIDVYFGHGIVGGPLVSVADVSRRAANVAVRILQGEAPSSIKTPPSGFGATRFDWRELQRWGIGEARLPAGSIVEFRVPTALEQYKWHIIAAGVLCSVQAIFIVMLLLHQRRLRRAHAERKRAEETARELSGHLISAQEDERSRLARELHDDVTQRLALLAIDAGRQERILPQAAGGGAMHAMREGLVRLSEDVHALSYRLHPSILDDLGLVEALKSECKHFVEAGSTHAEINVQEPFEMPPPAAALCLFRVAQEALQNVARHAGASAVEVILRPLNGGLQLAVRDNGTGFDRLQQRTRPSLGLASMRQRVDQLGGQLEITGALGHGTTIQAWVPLKEEASEPSARAAG
jgi:signal transduction histidine kinase